MIKRSWQALFWLVIWLGRPVGGFRPARIVHFLGRQAYKSDDVNTREFYTAKTQFGALIKVHPFYFLDRNVLLFGCYDKALHKLLKRNLRPGNQVLDVGANIGEVSIHMASLVGQEGMVHAFEPAPPICEAEHEYQIK